MATKYRDRPRTRPLTPPPQRQGVTSVLPEISLHPENPVPEQGAREDVIRTRAYFLWEQAGRPDCDSAQFWLEAEREIGSPS
jgi:hypothetical protein